MSRSKTVRSLSAGACGSCVSFASSVVWAILSSPSGIPIISMLLAVGRVKVSVTPRVSMSRQLVAVTRAIGLKLTAKAA